MERKPMSKDNKLSAIIIAIFFLVLLLMGTSSCTSRSGGMANDTIIFNKGKQAAHSQYTGLSAYLVSFNSTVEGKVLSGSMVILASNDAIALGHYRSKVVDQLGFSKIESLSFECHELQYEALLGPDIRFSRALR